MKIHGLIQARMGSSRLPGKVLKPLAGKPLIWHVIDRLRRVPGIEEPILATTTDPRNAPLVALAKSERLQVVLWEEEDDIVGRLMAATDLTGADAFLKVNSDCPLVDPGIMATVVKAFKEDGEADFACNKIVSTYPLGLSVELVSTKVLRWCNDNLSAPEDRELVIKWIMDRPQQFRCLSVEHTGNNGDLHMAVDTPEDCEDVSRIFEALYREGEAFGYQQIMEYLGRKVPNDAPIIRVVTE